MIKINGVKIIDVKISAPEPLTVENLQRKYIGMKIGDMFFSHLKDDMKRLRYERQLRADTRFGSDVRKFLSAVRKQAREVSGL